jgi:hypothetical protein
MIGTVGPYMPMTSLHRGLLLILGAFVCASSAQAAPAQASKPVPKAVPKPAVASPYDEDAARHIAESHGFYGIGRLLLDKAGVWRGTAIQFGRIVTIEIDHQGQFSGIEKRP